MVEKKKDEKQPEEKTAEKRPSGAKKTTARKPAAKKAAAGAKESAADAEKTPVEEESKVAPEEEVDTGMPEEKVETEAAEEEEEISEEEFRRMVEESLEKVTVSDIVLNIMNDLASLAYMKMGLPESVNLKYRDLDQASLAIDTLESMLKAAEGKMPQELLQPFRGTLANMQMNFVQLRRG
jgi:hypothetical protein